MADWKQITARIRRARGSKDPASQLSNLFQKTRDAMVAFELARHFETAGQHADAVIWYNTAAQRFRRADWKSKAIDAITRLGGEVSSVDSAALSPMYTPEDTDPGVPSFPSAELAAGEPDSAPPAPSEHSPEPREETSAPRPAGQEGRHRRGRRGGRNRRRPGSSSAVSPGTDHAAHVPRRTPTGSSAVLEAESIVPPRIVDSRSIPRLPVEPAPDAGTPGPKGRFGDPGLSSRLSALEMQFRRLLTCPPAKLDHADLAPAGPGVFVLTDDEMTTYYYVEACDTLRIAIANVARGGVGRRGAPSIKPLLAEHLGIPESRVSKYLSDHCVVRWLQLDEGATYFAHFVISVLRPALNE